MSDYSELVARLRNWSSRITGSRSNQLTNDAADAIDALTARVAQLEACLTDVKEQLELGGQK